MAPTYSAKREFIRYVYRRAVAESATRSEILDALADEHVPQDLSGKRLVGASGNGFSSSYQTTQASGPAYSLELINWARDYIAEADVEDAVALIPPPVRRFSPDFSGVRG